VSRLVLDAGAFIALDRDDRTAWGRLALAERARTPLVTHGGIVAQVWRTARQVRLARVLRLVDVVPLDRDLGRRAGELLAKVRGSDAIDAALVILSRSGDRILTSDPDDIEALADAARRDVEIVAV
jgi:hypothetical protein